MVDATYEHDGQWTMSPDTYTSYTSSPTENWIIGRFDPSFKWTPSPYKLSVPQHKATKDAVWSCQIRTNLMGHKEPTNYTIY